MIILITNYTNNHLSKSNHSITFVPQANVSFYIIGVPPLLQAAVEAEIICVCLCVLCFHRRLDLYPDGCTVRIQN